MLIKNLLFSAKGDDLERRCEIVNRELRVLSQMSGKNPLPNIIIISLYLRLNLNVSVYSRLIHVCL